jgi:hypothetical protein
VGAFFSSAALPTISSLMKVQVIFYQSGENSNRQYDRLKAICLMQAGVAQGAASYINPWANLRNQLAIYSICLG